MEEGLTPLVWSTIAQYGAIAGSFEAAAKALRPNIPDTASDN